MSAQNPIRRITAPQITARKGGEPIVCLTAYDAPTAALVDEYCDPVSYTHLTLPTTPYV